MSSICCYMYVHELNPSIVLFVMPSVYMAHVCYRPHLNSHVKYSNMSYDLPWILMLYNSLLRLFDSVCTSCCVYTQQCSVISGWVDGLWYTWYAELPYMYLLLLNTLWCIMSLFIFLKHVIERARLYCMICSLSSISFFKQLLKYILYSSWRYVSLYDMDMTVCILNIKDIVGCV